MRLLGPLLAIAVLISCKQRDSFELTSVEDRILNASDGSYFGIMPQCGRDIGYWRSLANKSRALFNYLSFQYSEDTLQGAIERALAWNHLYPIFYAHLSAKNKSFGWMTGAMYSAKIIRSTIKGLPDQYIDERVLKTLNKSMLVKLGVGRLAPSVQLKRALTEKLALGHTSVYDDLYWQHLAYQFCGSKEVRAALSRAEAADASIYMQAWHSLDQQRIADANIKLAFIEQYFILQKAIYSGALSHVAGWLFASQVLKPIDEPDFRVPTFVAFANETGASSDFANFDSRWPWMKQVLPEMLLYFEKHPMKVERVRRMAIQDGLDFMVQNGVPIETIRGILSAP